MIQLPAAVMNSFAELRIYLIFALPVLVVLLGMALYHRGRRSGWRLAGLIVSVLVIALLLYVYINALLMLRVESGGFSDVVLSLSAIPLASAGSVFIYGLFSKKLRPAISWPFPIAYAGIIALVTQWVTQGDKSLNRQNWAGFLLLIAAAVVSIPFSWFFCRFKRKAAKISAPANRS